MKYNKFKDIPQYTPKGNYEVNQPIRNLDVFIREMQDDYRLQLNTDFQRGHVWTEEQQIKYMEFFFRGGKSGRVLYFNNPSWDSIDYSGEYNDFVCVDGLQRLTAALRFINNEIKVFDTLYKEYEDKPSLGDHDFRININNLKSKSEVLRWYIEMNEGGTPHTTEEIDRVKRMLYDYK